METNNSNSALLVMDMQTSIVKMLPDASSIKTNVSKAITNAHKKNIPVIYIVVGFRQGMPEVGSTNKGFSAIKENMAGVNMEEWMKIDEFVAPAKDDLIVTKRRVSAFTGSDLEVILRAKNIKHLILIGIATSGVVLSTTREATDKDYSLTILSDGCADRDPEVHNVLITKVLSRQADVVTVDEWIKQ